MSIWLIILFIWLFFGLISSIYFFITTFKEICEEYLLFILVCLILIFGGYLTFLMQTACFINNLKNKRKK